MSFQESGSDLNFLHDLEKSLENNKETVTDFEWDLRNRNWEDEREKVFSHMLHNNIWTILFQKHKGLDNHTSELSPAIEEAEDSVNPTPPTPSAQLVGQSKSVVSNKSQSKSQAQVFSPVLLTAAVSNVSRIVWKVPKMTQLELFRFLEDWDKSSYGRRDKIIIDFIKTYDTKERIYCTDAAFHNGGSLIFTRFAVGLHICFKKNRQVWHYYDALGIFLKSLQSDRFTEEFLKLGGMNCIIQVVRVEESSEKDKLFAFKFLLNLMRSRNGHAVKQLVCETALFLESMIDSLTMCKSKELIQRCGQVFQELCVEISHANVTLICNYIMHALPCDFNPPLQSMAFKVLQSIIRLRPQLSVKCIKPILDNLKTANCELLVEMSNMSLVILQTKYGSDLITSLMGAAEGIQLPEVFRSMHKDNIRLSQSKSTKDSAEMKEIKEKREKARLKHQKSDRYMHQAGALFILNHTMSQKVEFVNDFIKKGIFGLSLNTLGACPHWEVQGQGVTMVKFLFSVSLECAISYQLMLPPKMLDLILNKPEECLRYFTSPICVFLRKLGRFALRTWVRWEDKVVSVAKMYAKGPTIPQEIFQMNQMARKVYELHQSIADLLDNPVMEAYPKTLDEEDIMFEESVQIQDFLDSSDDENLAQYKGGKDVILGDERFESFRSYLDEQEYEVPEDILDARVDRNKPQMLSTVDLEDKELDAYQIAMLAEAEKKKVEDKTDTITANDEIHGESEGEDQELHNHTIQDLPNTPKFN